MGALSPILRGGDGFVSFHCPGCGVAHQVRIGEGGWGYNGDPASPTFSPSILVRGHKLARDAVGRWNGGWERDADGNTIPSVCHSFVTDGQIQFLGDCTHALAGQAVPIPVFEV